MAKKLSLLLAAVAVLAFAVPALASAAPAVTSSAGVLAPVGSKVTGTNVGTITLTSATLGSITCETVTLKGELTKNTGTEVAGKGTGEGTTSACLNGGKSVTVTDLTVTGLSSTVAGKGTASFVSTIDLPSLTCVFTGTNVPFTYTSGSSNIVFTKGNGITSSPAACGTTTLDGTFKLEIGSTAVILD